jgi:NhaP-type Na+/H+ or K+/H+ antiporter
MVFVSIGLVGSLLGLAQIDLSHGFIHVVLELTLIIILFTDASRIDIKLLLKEHALVLRLLFIAIPLTILLGGIGAQFIFDFDNIWYAFLLAAILAPTDASLGQIVTSSKVIPVRIRQLLNVESGLNDGFVLPFILIIITIIKASDGYSLEDNTTVMTWVIFTLKQVLLGPIIGCIVAFIFGRMIIWATKHQWMNHDFKDLSIMCLSFLAYGAAELLGGNGFISAFFAGLTIGNTTANLCNCLLEFAEVQGQLLNLNVFLILGAVILPQFHATSFIEVITFSMLSLTLFRMIPVSLSLIGTRLSLPSHLFIGWFGPRGLASVLFALIMLKEIKTQETELIFSIILATVFLSIFFHGISANPLSKIYSKAVKLENTLKEEHIKVQEMPVKIGNIHSK